MKKQKPKAKEAMVVRDHIRELQWRFLGIFVFLVTAGVVSFLYYDQILNILRAPLHQELYYMTPVGSFAFIMRVSLIGGVAVAIPAIVYNALMFVRPGFSRPMSRGKILLVTLFSLSLAILGAAFSYFVIIPGALRFFSGFQVDGLSALIQADSYLNFVISALIIFMLMFQLPLIITLIDQMKRLPMKKLFKAERWVILGSLIAALLVPFAMDLSVSLLISLPIILLYNLSILIVAIRHAMTKKSSSVKKATPAAKIPATPVKQPIASFSTPIKVAAAPSPARQTKPKTTIAPKQTAPIRANPSRRTMDISPYPINNSAIVPDAKTVPGQTKKPVSPSPRTAPRPASRLIVPERESYTLGRIPEFDPEIS